MGYRFFFNHKSPNSKRKCNKLHLVRLVEEVSDSLANTMNESIRVTNHIEAQYKDIDLANTLWGKKTNKQKNNEALSSYDGFEIYNKHIKTIVATPAWPTGY